METQENNNMKKSMSSDTDSNSDSQTKTNTKTQRDSPHSPLRSHMDSTHSPLRSDQPEPPPEKSPSKAMVAVDKHSHGGGYSPFRPLPRQDQQKPANPPENTNAAAKSPVVVFNRSMREELSSVVTKVEPGGEDGGGGERKPRAVTSILRRSRRESMVKRAALGFRVCEVVLCLISFSVMAADKTQGWSGDSFERYKEYRYCLSMTVIAFVYAGFQACDLAYNLVNGKHLINHHLRYHFDFSMDQILAYLLISASSSAATRVDDWQSNWGKDEFTEMASASVGMSFLAFAAFAISSLISGYNLCTCNFT